MANSPAPDVSPEAVERKKAARDVHYALIEEYGLRDDSLTNHAVRSLLERLAVDNVQSSQLEAARRNEARYLWMRSDGLRHVRLSRLTCDTCDSGMDAAIDAAMAAGESQP